MRERLARHRNFLLFAAIGGVGTFVDLGALWVALHGLHANVYIGRVFSFLCAASFNWLCNRKITFTGERSHRPAVEYLRFIGVSAVGGAANFAVYSAIVAFTPSLIALSPAQTAILPYLGVVVGSGAGLAFNYTGASRLVFCAPPVRPKDR